jgi:hypothetical protein
MVLTGETEVLGENPGPVPLRRSRSPQSEADD